ncbi:ATP-dependent sacrificial sulfur transferase LarE [uncultured Serinicoccus sp.]|uniref:ATP-dependent sacrificial sulfur transferase LarE n=1 Tax=uncultured Serinicoccus sp. TaxID=735514 RepID=UPI0026208ECD|nr:ATP-dependent sacrificial sulfur transferase LarE [uncultured Serinicoccus sp.]
MSPPEPDHLRAPLAAFRRSLHGVRRLGVAYSGGVDSSVLLALALQQLGSEQVVAVTALSPSLASRDRRRARAVAEDMGATLVDVPTREGEREAYRRNDVDRCYHCKDELFTVIDTQLVAQHALDAVAYGENADDALRPDRPGSRAAQEHRVLRPLADAGMTKAVVREVATWLGLATAQTPASPCLASRIPHHEEVTPAKLMQVERAEDAILALGVSDVRVRHHGDLARIEVPVGELSTVLAARSHLLAEFRRVGFRHITVDLAGLQSGVFTLEAMGLRGVTG